MFIVRDITLVGEITRVSLDVVIHLRHAVQASTARPGPRLGILSETTQPYAPTPALRGPTAWAELDTLRSGPGTIVMRRRVLLAFSARRQGELKHFFRISTTAFL